MKEYLPFSIATLDSPGDAVTGTDIHTRYHNTLAVNSRSTVFGALCLFRVVKGPSLIKYSVHIDGSLQEIDSVALNLSTVKDRVNIAAGTPTAILKQIYRVPPALFNVGRHLNEGDEVYRVSDVSAQRGTSYTYPQRCGVNMKFSGSTIPKVLLPSIKFTVIRGSEELCGDTRTLTKCKVRLSSDSSDKGFYIPTAFLVPTHEMVFYT